MQFATLLSNSRRAVAATLILASGVALLGIVVAHGDTSGLGLSAELEQGFAQLLFIAVIGYPALSRRTLRLTPSDNAILARNLIYAFSGAFLALMLCVALQATTQPGPPPLSMLVSLATSTLVLVAAIGSKWVQQRGRIRGRIVQTLHILALAYFWAYFALLDGMRIGRSRLSDPFFTIALALLVAALVLRLTDLWTARHRVAGKVG